MHISFGTVEIGIRLSWISPPLQTDSVVPGFNLNQLVVIGLIGLETTSAWTGVSSLRTLSEKLLLIRLFEAAVGWRNKLPFPQIRSVVLACDGIS